MATPKRSTKTSSRKQAPRTRRKAKAEARKAAPRAGGKRIRYAVVGQGYISQIAILPAFANARRNSELVALVSDDPEKLRKLGKRYKVARLLGYEDFEALVASDAIDAVFIALPNHLHHAYTLRAVRAGKHVLCEKPMAVTVDECREMVEEAEANRVQLMIAYRLHFERANLRAVQIAHSRRLGDLRVFNSVFCMQVEEGNIRLQAATGGGTLYDIGIYCINAARYLFRDEPTEVVALTASNGESRFAEVPEMTSCILRFPEERLATFTCSFGAAEASSYDLVGTEGFIHMNDPYTFAGRDHADGDDREEDAGEDLRADRPVRPGAALLLRLHPEQARAGAVRRRGLGRRAHHPRAARVRGDRAAREARALRPHPPAGARAGRDPARRRGARAGRRPVPPSGGLSAGPPFVSAGPGCRGSRRASRRKRGRAPRSGRGSARGRPARAGRRSRAHRRRSR
jgi:glucose-fructose oxidoreductase